MALESDKESLKISFSLSTNMPIPNFSPDEAAIIARNLKPGKSAAFNLDGTPEEVQKFVDLAPYYLVVTIIYHFEGPRQTELRNSRPTIEH